MSTSVLSKYDRATWIPVTEPGDGAPYDSKFGGSPYMPEGAKWPTCGLCSLPLQFVLQLDLDRLPVVQDTMLDLGFFENLNNKVFQFFMCENYDCLCEDGCLPGKFATRPSVVVKTNPRVTNPPLAEPFSARLISNWEKRIDPIPVDELMWYSSDTDDQSIDDNRPLPYDGDKLLGWPFWVRESRHMECERCGSDMSFWFQLDSQKNVPFAFGKGGKGHILICPVDLHAGFIWDSQ